MSWCFVRSRAFERNGRRAVSSENVDSPETWDEMDELAPTAEELAEAASLARAMDGAHGDLDSVDDEAMATASLLAYSEGAAELRPERAASVLDDVLKTARRPEKAASARAAGKAPARSWWRFLVPLPFAAAAAAAFFVLNTDGAVLPSPSMSLIEAQATAAAGVEPNRLDDEMSDYRSQLYAALEEGY